MSKLELYNAQGYPLFKVDVSCEIDRGGEGAILPHPKDPRQVIKIYHDRVVPSFTPAAWPFLNNLGDRFIKPLELFYSKSGALVGFSMQLLESSFFRLSQVFTKNQCAKWGIDSSLKLRLSKELVAIIEEAHSKDVVIGDFNPFNIFIAPNGAVRMIDVDSYETPARKHSGRLLDEIRDHYYLGAVTQESDYYALAVNVFRMLTYVHPYKGTHKVYKQLEERAVKKISVLSTDNDLTIPAFYEPVGSPELESQFRRIFNEGERFLLNIDQVGKSTKRIVAAQTLRTDISVKILATDVLDVYFTQGAGYIKTPGHTEFYECNFAGSPTWKAKMDNDAYDFLWVGNKNVLKVKDNKLYHQQNLVTNFEIPANFRSTQVDHHIFGVDWENIYHLQPDKIINNNLLWQKNPAWGRGFRLNSSPVQLTGGVARVHYRNGDILNSVKLPSNPKNLELKGNIGLISFLENEKIRYYWCLVNGLNFELCKETEELYSFAVKQMAGNSFVFVPKDGVVEVLRVPDFEKLDAIDFKECTSQSQVFLTNSGLMLLQNQVVYLINRN